MKPVRRLLPVLTPRLRHGNRSHMTCQYRCGNACDKPIPNRSDNGYFGDLMSSRRGVLRAGSLGALVIGTGGVLSSASAQAQPTVPPLAEPDPNGFGGELSFDPVPPNTDDAVTIPSGYEQHIVVEWGTPLFAGVPAFDIDEQTAQAQRGQFGYNNDYLGVLPLQDKDRALLVANHEYTNEELMFRDYSDGDNATEEQIKISMAAHGMSVVEIRRDKDTGRWRTTMEADDEFSAYNRRFHLGTEFAFTGPATGHELLITPTDPQGTSPYGTLNNCAGGRTPWGTVVSGEENIDQYFVAGDSVDGEAKEALERYGFNVDEHHAEDNRRFDRVDERWDLSTHPNEANRAGWIVEIDPYDPESTPRKHTAMGRFKHEGANPIVSTSGHVACYMGDDQAFEYLYKFVTAEKYLPDDREHNLRLLENGTLYVAKLSFTSEDEIDGSGKLPSDGAFDGAGEWIPLVSGDESFVEGFTAAEVLVHTRMAADTVGATKMDRPEDVEPNLLSGKIYAALTNNEDRGGEDGEADEANPRNENKHGQIFEITEDNGDHTATTFTWNLPIVCGDPEDESTFFAGYDKSKVSPISCPDNVAFDSSGKNLWISTDGNALDSNDGLFAVPLVGEDRGWLRQFLSVPRGAETCGPFVAADNKTVFVAVQHPGEVDGATVDDPASVWPHGEYANPAVVCVWHSEGKDIGR